MIHNTTDIRIYSEPPPPGVVPVKHDRKWRRIFSFEFDGLPYSSTCSPKHFNQKGLMTIANKNSRYNTKRGREILFKPHV
jgi:hypothetical protein